MRDEAHGDWQLVRRTARTRVPVPMCGTAKNANFARSSYEDQ